MTVQELHTLVIGNDAVFRVYRDRQFIYRVSQTVIDGCNIDKLTYEFPISVGDVEDNLWSYLPDRCAAVELWRCIKKANAQNLLELVTRETRYECTDEMPVRDVIEVRNGSRIVCHCGCEFGAYNLAKIFSCLCGQEYRCV